jgi:hypothetical protein
MREIFGPVVRCISKFSEMIFNAGYGVIPVRTWRTSETICANAYPPDTVRKAIVRILLAADARTPKHGLVKTPTL